MIRPDRPGHGLRLRLRLTSQDFKDLRACLRHHTELADQSVIQGTFPLSRLWARVLFDFGASHSLIVASCVEILGLEVETLEEPLHVSSPQGAKASVE